MKKIAALLLLLITANLKHSDAQTFTTLSSGCNNKVYAIAGDVSSNNTIYAGGEFGNAGGGLVNHVAKWNGSAWSAMDNGMDSYVRSLAFFNNELYAAGDFIHVGTANTVVWMVTKWNGTTWTALASGIRGAGVYSLAVYQNQLYAGGFFDTIFNQGNGIVKWNGSGWVALGGTFGNGVGGAPGYRVRAMKAFGGELYIGGTFATAGGVTVNNIAKWDGASWSAIGSGTNGDVNAFVSYNGELYVGGDFTTANGVTVNHIAKITGSTFAAIGGGTDGIVNGLANYQGSLYATGLFTTSGAVTTQNISRWDGSWHHLTPSIPGIDGPGYCLTQFSGDLYIGGFFAVAGTVIQANSIVKWNFPVGIEETGADANDDFQIFPNPASGKFQLQLTGSIPEKFDLYITDVSGRNLYYKKFESYHLNNQIDIAPFKSGMYFLKLVNGSKVQTVKLTVE